jgi:hypothetical protein
MSEQDKLEQNRLVDLDPHDPTLRGRYGAALGAQLDERLSAPPRGGYAMALLAGLGGLIGFVVCGSLAVTEPASLPPRVRAILGLFACIGLAWIVFATWALSRSRGNFAWWPTSAAQLVG